VRASHGSARDGVGGGGRANPSRKDVETRGKDIDGAAEVGEVGAGVVAADSADGDGRRGGGGGSAGGVNGFDKGAGLRVTDTVSGSDDGQNTLLGSGVDKVVEGGRDRVLGAKRHVDDGLASATLVDDVVGGPLEALHDGGSGTGLYGD